MKKVLEVRLTENRLIEVRLEATKRKKIWLKMIKANVDHSCDSSICPLYFICQTLKSPLKKYPNFGEFCNKLFSDYPELPLKLATEYGVTNINQVVPVMKNNDEKSYRN